MTTPQGGAFTDPDFIMEYMRMCPAKFWGVIKSHGALKMKTVVAASECFPSVASSSSGGDALANPYIAKWWWWWSFPSWGRFSPTWTSAKWRHIKIGFTRPRYSSYFSPPLTQNIHLGEDFSRATSTRRSIFEFNGTTIKTGDSPVGRNSFFFVSFSSWAN